MQESVKKRVLSPSSINCYLGCPRKFYYSYIEELEGPPNIHQVRGKVAHSVLEHFFDTDVSGVSKGNCQDFLFQRMQELLAKEWVSASADFALLNLPAEATQSYFEETVMMLFNWLEHFVGRVNAMPGDFPIAFRLLTPVRETMFVSEHLSVRGIIDAIENTNNEVRIMDYKTSSSFDETEHKLQLAIYSLLYSEKFGRLPDKAGIYFLKDRPKFIEVNDSLIDFAKATIDEVHAKTSSENIVDYPRSPGRKCKWSSGQCEFFEICKPFENNANSS